VDCPIDKWFRLVTPLTDQILTAISLFVAYPKKRDDGKHEDCDGDGNADGADGAGDDDKPRCFSATA